MKALGLVSRAAGQQCAVAAEYQDSEEAGWEVSRVADAIKSSLHGSHAFDSTMAYSSAYSVLIASICAAVAVLPVDAKEETIGARVNATVGT